MIEKFPFDMDALQKGDVLTEAFLREKIPDLPDASTDAYKLMVLGIRKYVEMAFIEHGDLVYVKSENNGLRILPDVEASPYIEKQQRKDRKRMAKNAAILEYVETKAFSPAETREHEMRLMREGRYLQAQRQITMNLKALATAKTNVAQLEKTG